MYLIKAVKKKKKIKKDTRPWSHCRWRSQDSNLQHLCSASYTTWSKPVLEAAGSSKLPNCPRPYSPRQCGPQHSTAAPGWPPFPLPLTPQAAADSGLRPFQGAQLTPSCLAHLSLLPISTAFPYSAQKEHSKGRDPNFPKPLWTPGHSGARQKRSGPQSWCGGGMCEPGPCGEELAGSVRACAHLRAEPRSLAAAGGRGPGPLSK